MTDYTVTSKALTSTKADCLVVSLPEKGNLPTSTAAADDALGGQISELRKSGDLNGKTGTMLLLPLKNQPWKRLLVVGSGDKQPVPLNTYRTMVRGVINRLKDTPVKQALIALSDVEVAARDEAWRLNLIGRTAEEQLYRFTAFKSSKDTAPALKKITVHASSASATHRKALDTGVAVGGGMSMTRDLGNTPPNVCHPKWLASQAEKLGKAHDNITVKALDEKEMKKLGMDSLLSVSAGSTQPARLIIMEYKGAGEKQKPHVLVGKGITFDSGGISLKPGAGMDEMKYDMGGAASVFGAMEAVGSLQPKMNVVAIVAAAENMPDGNATRPGDIVKTMSGQTVEILNTDAEGRLVLCDALTYAERYEPETVVNMATLTGACIIALGGEATGLFSNDDALAEELMNAGETAGDRAWRLPIWDEYQSLLDSNFADMQNIGGRGAGSITAACFLSRFTKSYRWAHLDIAGTAWLTGKEKGSTGRPVPLLMEYLLSHAK